MASKSVLASALASGTSTPNKNTESLDSDFTSPLFSSQLLERLKQLRLNQADGSVGIGAKPHHFIKNGLVHSIEVLSEDRRKSSELAREQALATLLRHLVMKYDPSLMHFELFSTIVQSFTTARTELEAVTSLQLICVSVTLLEDSEDVRSSDSFELAVQLQQSLLKRVKDASSVSLRQAIITSHSVLTYFMNAGGGGYGMETAVSNLMEIAESVSGAENAPVVAAALKGAALLSTLTSSGSAGEIADGWLFSLVPMLEVPQSAARLATVKLIAVLLEITSREVLKTGDNAEACDGILDALEGISQEPVSRTAKSDKKIQNLLVKSVLQSCRRLLDGPECALDKKDFVSDLVSHYHKQTVSKSFGIRSWVGLAVIEHLGWVFGPGIHNHLANNPYIKSLLAKEEVHVESSSISRGDAYAEPGTSYGSFDVQTHKLDAAKRSKELRKQQLEKAQRQESQA